MSTALASVAILGACGESPDPGPAPDAADREAAPLLFDGLSVPSGAALAGAVFFQPNNLGGSVVAPESEPMPDTRTALLTIDGDPFEVWDELAAQFAGLDPPVAMPGSADSCTWHYPNGLYPELHGEGEALSAAESDDWLEVTADPPDPRADGIICDARVPIRGDGPINIYEMSLVASDRAPMALVVTSTWWPFGFEEPAWKVPTALLSDVRASLAANTPGSDPVAQPGSEAVPEAASENLPPVASQPTPRRGDPFGGEVNCFAAGGGPQTILPEGARLLADARVHGDVSILAVTDATAVIDGLRQQFEGDGSDFSSSSAIEVLDLDDGAQVQEYSHLITGGGGGCRVLESPDGSFLMIFRGAD